VEPRSDSHGCAGGLEHAEPGKNCVVIVHSKYNHKPHMNPPQPVKNAIHAIWLCIGLSVIAALLDRLTGRMPTGEFAFNVMMYGLTVMIPYKLTRRSNATRVIFAVLIAVSLLIWLGGVSVTLPPFSRIASIVELPIIALSIYWLFFIPSASEWFSGVADNDEKKSVVERVDPKL
jgi:hypothetical protein